MPVQVKETTLTTCPPPSTAASIANLEYPEEPLPTAASVASEECLEPLPMAVTVFSYGCPDLPRTDDPNTPPGQTSVVCCMEQCTYVCVMCTHVYMIVTMHVFCLTHCVYQHMYVCVCIQLNNVSTYEP